MKRRDFLRMAAGAAAVALVPDSSEATPGEIPRRILGRTGEEVSIVGIGGHHIGRPSDEQLGISLVRTALDHGINFLDNCWDYNGGDSELRMGKALRDGYRHRAFLMTKIDGQTAKTATEQLEESLRRLQTDYVDLLQFHEIIRMTDPERVFANGGMEAVLAARKAGKVRYIGFSGHKSPAIHLHMLDVALAHGFVFDAVQMPLNVMDAHFDSFEKQVLPELVKHNIGVLGMKSMGDRWILDSKVVTAPECLRYAMSLPTSVVITGCESMEILQQAIDVALSFKPMSREEMASLLARTAEAASSGVYEKYKTSDYFDGTNRNLVWLG